MKGNDPHIAGSFQTPKSIGNFSCTSVVRISINRRNAQYVLRPSYPPRQTALVKTLDRASIVGESRPLMIIIELHYVRHTT